jgi:hypothetical protein
VPFGPADANALRVGVRAPAVFVSPGDKNSGWSENLSSVVEHNESSAGPVSLFRSTSLRSMILVAESNQTGAFAASQGGPRVQASRFDLFGCLGNQPPRSLRSCSFVISKESCRVCCSGSIAAPSISDVSRDVEAMPSNPCGQGFPPRSLCLLLVSHHHTLEALQTHGFANRVGIPFDCQELCLCSGP